MMYLLSQLAGWLLLTAAFAALAGWAFAARRAAPIEARLRGERTGLADSLGLLARDGAPDQAEEPIAVRELDTVRRLSDINVGRIAELERSLAAARASADENASRVAELERALEQRANDVQARAFVEVEPAPVDDGEPDAVALQGWRLRYFEQRVRYLESLGAPTAVGPSPAPQPVAAPPASPAPEAPLQEWRARVAEARAAHLEDILRTPAPATAANGEFEEAPDSPFAANADVDTLLRWRMLYLERRAAYLQQELDAAAGAPALAPIAAPIVEAAPDPDRWKWRARYLEARVRHLESRPAPAAMHVSAPPDADDEAPPPPPAAHAEKPPVLAAARNGAPDDLRLIDGVSAMQQSTLNSLGVWHFDQIAAWTPAHIAWIDRYLRLRGRIGEEEWIEQAADLAREGPAAARRVLEDEDA